MNQILGKELRNIRLKRGMNLDQAANEIGITNEYLNKIEDGARDSVPFEIMVHIARTYELPLDYLSGFLDENQPKKPISEKELELWNVINEQVKEEVYYKRADNVFKYLFSIFKKED